jgi:hypothetical protein
VWLCESPGSLVAQAVLCIFNKLACSGCCRCLLHGKSSLLRQVVALQVEHSLGFTFASESEIIIACGDILALKKTRHLPRGLRQLVLAP